MKGLKRLLILFGVFLFNVIVLLCAIALLAFIADGGGEPPWEFILISASVIVGTQIVFVLPFVKPPTITTKGKSLIVSSLIASIAGSFLVVGFAAGVFSFITSFLLDNQTTDEYYVPVFMYSIGAAWIVWSVLLLMYIKRKNYDPSGLVRITSWMFAGSVVEMLLMIPFNVMVIKRTDCYCATGSFLSLTLSVFATLWLFGPFMVILLAWRKRPWTKDHCFSCGYPRKVRDAKECSECGVSFKTQE
jgi:hypothetical protein